MTAKIARDYLTAGVVTTEVGRKILIDLGYGSIISRPTEGDDASTIRIARQVQKEFARRYPMLDRPHVLPT